MDCVAAGCALAGCALAGCCDAGFFCAVVAEVLGVSFGAGEAAEGALDWLCANPSAAANKVSVMVFMIPLSYLLGRLPRASGPKWRCGNNFFHAVHHGAVGRRV